MLNLDIEELVQRVAAVRERDLSRCELLTERLHPG